MARLVVVGGTGLIGAKIAEAVLLQGHECVVVSRGETPENAQTLADLDAGGAQIAFVSPENVPAMTKILKGSDAVICAITGEADVIDRIEPKVLQAAQAARVKRFVPNEFGLDTLRIPPGAAALFDEKKMFQSLMQEEGVPYTVIFNGGIFDYFLPNLREYAAITTFGDDYDVPYYTHAREDIGAITVRAALDPRCENQCVHLRYNLVSQNEVLDLLHRNYPGYDFPTAHVSTEEINDGTHQVKAAIWIAGHAGVADPHCLDPVELYPDYRFKSVADALADPQFVFGDKTYARAG
jgi:uncharacterized protein YbjT (DUF2867 family)